MARRDKRAIEDALNDKGYRPHDNDHKRFIYWTFEGRKTPVHTKTSYSHRDIGGELLGKMGRQCRLSTKDFLDLIDCPLTREVYEKKLLEAGAI